MLISSVSAFGIKPALTRVAFAPELIYESQFTIVRDSSETVIARLNPGEELAPYISFASDYVTLSGAETVLPYTLRLPKTLKPGQHLGIIYVEEGIAPDAAGVTGRIRLPYKILVDVPFPDKYIEATLDVKSVGSELGITTTVENKGREPIDRVTPTVTIANAEQPIASVALDTQAIPLASVASFQRVIDVGTLQSGIYQATGAIAFDDNVLEVIKNFAVGNPTVKITTQDSFFKLNEVNVFDIDVENQWNAPLRQMRVEVAVLKSGAQVSQYVSEPFDLDTGETHRVSSYFDTRSLPLGAYSAKVIATYDGGQAEEIFPIEVVGVEDYDVRLARAKSFATVPWSAVGFAVLFIMNAILVIFIVVKLRKPESASASDAVTAFVAKARRMGFTDDEIRVKLQKEGWAPGVIEHGLK